MRIYKGFDGRWYFKLWKITVAFGDPEPQAPQGLDCFAEVVTPLVVEKQINYRLTSVGGKPVVLFRVAPPGTELVVTFVGVVLSPDYRFSKSFTEVVTLAALATLVKGSANPFEPEAVIETVSELLLDRIGEWLRLEPNEEQWSQPSSQRVDKQIRTLIQALEQSKKKEI